MRAETPVDKRPGTIFEAEAEDAPGIPHEADVPQRASSNPGLQRLCTRQLGRSRRVKFEAIMDLLPPVDQRAIAWHYSKQKALFATLPDRTSVLGRHEFAGAVALYLGLSDPLVVDFLAAGGPRASHFQDQRALRRLDPWGNKLSLFMGKGHGRTCFHNEVQRELARLARSVGYPIREIPSDLFLVAIDPEARNRYLREIRETRERGVFRGPTYT